jgi:hypothetical protein
VLVVLIALVLELLIVGLDPEKMLGPKMGENEFEQNTGNSTRVPCA